MPFTLGGETSLKQRYGTNQHGKGEMTTCRKLQLQLNKFHAQHAHAKLGNMGVVSAPLPSCLPGHTRTPRVAQTCRCWGSLPFHGDCSLELKPHTKSFLYRQACNHHPPIEILGLRSVVGGQNHQNGISGDFWLLSMLDSGWHQFVLAQ